MRPRSASNSSMASFGAHDAAQLTLLSIPARLIFMPKSGSSSKSRLNQFLRWFMPGLGVKRWLLSILAGITLLGVGLAIFLLDLYRTGTSNPAAATFLSDM